MTGGSNIISPPKLALLLGLLLSACAEVAPPPPPPAAEAPTTRIVVSADPRATAAGMDMLSHGGSAIDAAVAAQAVLGLVEPQASGLLGGTLLLLWSPHSGQVDVFDGMPTAPAAATKALALGLSGTLLDPREVAFSGRAVGIPGTLPALWEAHRAAGRLPWADLFAPAIALAEAGTGVSRSLHDLLAQPGAAAALGSVVLPYLASDGTALPIGAIYRNPDYAAVLKRVARMGPEGLYAEGGLSQILAGLSRGAHASLISAADLQGYRPRIGRALCSDWQGHRICTAPPPAMGGVVMLQILGAAGAGSADDPAWLHRFLESSRLAEADRRRYLADPEFVPVPTDGLLDPAYLASRAATIAPDTSMERPMPGNPAAAPTGGTDPGAPQTATSALAIVDGDGRVVSMTSTINLHFGARLGAMGMVFNNALINFAPPPPTTLKQSRDDRYANEMAPGKRPLSPIAPTIVLDGDTPILAAAGAGGPQIPDTMAMLLIDLLANHRTPEQALAALHVQASDPDHIAVEPPSTIGPALEALGHRVVVEPVDTGNVVLQRVGPGWRGAADPRRDGVAQGSP